MAEKPHHASARSPEYALLGFLYDRPMHGYTLHQKLVSELGHVWHVSQSQSYAILKRLEAQGYITATTLEQAKRPPRLLLQITTPGRSRFEEWLRTPTGSSVHLIRLEFITRLYFAQKIFPELIPVMFKEESALINTAIARLKKGSDAIPQQQPFNRLSMELRIRQLISIRDWLIECRKVFEKNHKANSMKKLVLFVLLSVTILAACGPAAAPVATPTLLPHTATLLPPTDTPLPPTPIPQPRTLTVFAAASLTDAFTEIGKDFETANPDVSVTFNFAGSQTLSAQLTQGAKADIFASANHTEMDKVVAANLVHKDVPKDFLTNQLLVILPKANPANIQTIQDLARPGLKLVLADATVPAGKYARQILDNLSKDPNFGPDFGTKVLVNVVSNETDVKLVVAKVQLGEADAGIVYISDSVAAPDLKTIQIPANDNVIAKYPIAALTNAPQPDLAAAFITYVLSSDGQAILQKWGFTPIAP